MNRRRFAQAIAAAAFGLRGCREPVLAEPVSADLVLRSPGVVPFTDEQIKDSAGGFLVSEEFIDVMSEEWAVELEAAAAARHAP